MSEYSSEYTQPSSENDESKDYGDGQTSEESKPATPRFVGSAKIHTPPMIIRLENKIRNIIGESSDEYISFLATIIYNWKIGAEPYPPKHDEIVKYIDKRITW